MVLGSAGGLRVGRQPPNSGDRWPAQASTYVENESNLHSQGPVFNGQNLPPNLASRERPKAP